ncbi:MAG: hypothetical protein ACRD3E_02810 [Terriglobales bacterium]
MYSGHMLQELMEMVARAEQNAREMKLEQNDELAKALYAPALLHEASNRAYMGAA